MQNLYHYYEAETGPFLNLSELPLPKAKDILSRIRAEGKSFVAQRQDTYMERRLELEALARRLFMEKGGKPVDDVPQYMVVGPCPWLASWYVHSACVAIPWDAFDPATLSFSYGDLFPTFSPRVNDGREYRRQIYTAFEIQGLIARYGLPQDWNPDGAFGPERYIEVQVWDKRPLLKYLAR